MPALEQLTQAPLADAATYAAGQDVLSFVIADRNVVCSLTPEHAGYGECRSGVTQQEAEFGPKGSRKGPISQLPVLDDGQNLERNGLRCSAYKGGVACGNVSAGVAFFVSRESYELISDAGRTAAQGPSDTPKTP